MARTIGHQRPRTVRDAAPAEGRKPQQPIASCVSKDKLGTRSMASGEILLEGAVAYLVGDAEDQGLKQMMEQVNLSQTFAWRARRRR